MVGHVRLEAAQKLGMTEVPVHHIRGRFAESRENANPMKRSSF